MSVPVNTQPRSTPLRLFFFCWVCYTVAISTVFQAYLTTFLIEPGYEEPMRNIDEMLKFNKKVGLFRSHYSFFNLTSDLLHSAIVTNAVQCPDELTCFTWAALYHNVSVLIKVLDLETYRAMGNWTDANKRPLLCELDDGVFRTLNYAFMVKKGFPLFKLIDNILSHIFEGGIFIHIKKRSFDKLKIESKLDVPTFDDTYYAINFSHLQTAFYLLILGYVFAGACFATEVMCHYYNSKGRGTKVTNFRPGQT
jgi:hypothetical protein